MATLNDSTFREGQSTTRPPFFDGNDYAYWKTRMRIYLQALDYEIWEVVCDGPFMPTFKDEVGDDIPKPSSQWSELEKRKMSLNSKAMNALFCALDKKEFYRVSSCESAQEIWNKLEVVYEGTNQVKESKISRYTRQYELFQMEQNENVYSMYTRFTDIVNTLGALGKTFSNSEKVKKIIRSLPKEWRPKRTAIEEAKDLNTLPLDNLIGSLISYEEDLAAEKEHEEKKKSIALKASKHESDGESEPDDKELAMLARRFRKFFKKTGERNIFRNFKNHRKKKEAITCYEWKKPGHIRSECPLINKLKKKVMVATWDDSEEESSDEEASQEVSNLALMAIGGDNDLNEGLKKKKNKWYLDIGCSRHMTRNYAWFSSFTKIENGGDVSFGDNSKGKILGIGNVGKVSSTLIENVRTCMDLISKISKDDLVKDNLGKFDPKSDVSIFLGYSNSSKAYRVYNKRTLVVEESMHVTFDESNPSSTEKVVVDDNAEEEQEEEEASNDIQEDAPHIIQEEHHEEPNVEQNEGTSQTLPKEWRRKSVPPRNPIPPWEVSEFSRIHFPTPSLAKRFEDRFDGRKVLDHFFVDIDDFRNLVVCGRSIRDMLQPWEAAIDLDDRVYPNLVRVFYSNMEISDTRPNRIVTQVGRVSIEFDVVDLADFLAVNHRLLPYGNIITKILRRFELPLLDTGHMETRRIGPEAMTSIGFSRKNGQWIKTSNSKNRDTLIAAEDDWMLNDIYPPDQLPDFRLGAHPPPPRRRFVPRPPADSDSEERAMDADIPSSSEPLSPPEPSAVPEQPSASMPPPAPVQPPASEAV
ncbi:hypothetical protein KPL70_014367 [Citrus sinensis]|nr:hypothetical protein KPL70_014367 [Citrus sinensis]